MMLICGLYFMYRYGIKKSETIIRLGSIVTYATRESECV